MKKKRLQAIFCLLAAGVLLINAVGCSVQKAKADDLMKGVSAKTVSGREADDAFVASQADFAVKLFRESVKDGENSLISPLSVMLALAMTANGADTQTKAEMETVLGGDIPLEGLNEYLYSYMRALSDGEHSPLKTADSIWISDSADFAVNPDFLQVNADYYGADAKKAPFDEHTRDEINNWVKEKTDGMIDKIVEEIPADVVLYLINALAFDAEWENIYETSDVFDGKFTDSNGIQRTLQMMNSIEHRYIETDTATGFIKNYAGGQYGFAALLPKKELSLRDYVHSLSGEDLINSLKTAQDTAVMTTMPKFSYDYELIMNDALCAIGMPTAFNPLTADFSKMTQSETGGLYISRVIHKTHIAVDERGTKAGAATAVEMRSGASMIEKEVCLDRPFLFMIVDNRTNLPIFIGTFENTEK